MNDNYMDTRYMKFFSSHSPKHFSELIYETKSTNEKEGIETLFSMMIALRQQIILRKKAEDEIDVEE